MAAFLTLALQCLFPLFELNPSEWVGLSVVNPDSQTHEFTVTATSADGSVSQSGSLSLGPGAQRSRLLGEILGGPLQIRTGSIRIGSSLPVCTTYMATGTDEVLAGTDAASATGTTIFIPHVSVNTGFMELNHTDTHIAVLNPNSGVATVTVQLYGLDGASRGSIPLSVPPHGSSAFRVSEAFRDVIPNNTVAGKTFEGYARIISNIGVAAWQRVDTPLTQSMLRGGIASDIPLTTLAIIPHFIFDGTYRSTLNLLNPGDAPVSLELTAVNDRGQNIGEVIKLTLAPGHASRASVGELFRVVLPAIFPPPRVEGHIRIRQSEGSAFQLLGDIQISTEASSVMHPLSETAAARWTMPFAVSSFPWTTSFVIANPNELLTVQTDVQVEELNSDGVVTARETISLSPRTRRAGVVSSRLAAGYLRFTSNFPIVVLGTVGTEDGRRVDQIPAIR